MSRVFMVNMVNRAMVDDDPTGFVAPPTDSLRFESATAGAFCLCVNRDVYPCPLSRSPVEKAFRPSPNR